MPEMIGRLEDPALGGLGRLQRLEGEAVLGVGRGHVGLLQPPGVRRHVGLGLEGQGSHVVHEQGHALLGQGGPEGVHRLERRIQLHQPVDLLGGLGDAGILVGALQGRGRDGMGRLPLEQRPGHGVEPEQLRQHARPRAGQPDNDPRADDALLSHLGVLLCPALQCDAVGQGPCQHLGDEDAPKGGQFGLGLTGAEEHPERLAKTVAAQVIRPSRLGRRRLHRGRGQGREFEPQPGESLPCRVERPEGPAAQLRVAPGVFDHARPPGLQLRHHVPPGSVHAPTGVPETGPGMRRPVLVDRA